MSTTHTFHAYCQDCWCHEMLSRHWVTPIPSLTLVVGYARFHPSIMMSSGNNACPSSKPGRFDSLFLRYPLSHVHGVPTECSRPHSRHQNPLGTERTLCPQAASVLSCPGPEEFYYWKEVTFICLLFRFWRTFFPISLWCLQKTFGQFLSSVTPAC